MNSRTYILIVNSLNTEIVPGYISSVSEKVDSQGWYRIARAKSFRQYPPDSCIISIKRHYNHIHPEYQRIQFLGAYTKCRFISLSAISGLHLWDKIRETYDETNGTYYMEIYQNRSSENVWIISLEETLSTSGIEYNWKAMAPELTSETVSGVTVLASLDLPANNPA